MANMVHIDGAKLRRLIEARGLKMAAVSREMGFSSEYVKQCCARNNMSQGGMKMLQVMFGFNAADYEYVEPPKEEPMPEPVQEEIILAQEVRHTPMAALDLEELKQAVAMAMQTMQAPEIDYSKIRDAVCEGLLDATYQLINNSEQRNMITGLLSHSVKVGMSMNLDERLKGAKR